jgi:hypothetical protein
MAGMHVRYRSLRYDCGRSSLEACVVDANKLLFDTLIENGEILVVRYWWLFVPKFKYGFKVLVHHGRAVLFQQVEHVARARSACYTELVVAS